MIRQAGNDVLTEQDKDNIRAFKLKLMANMPRVAFNQMRYAFSNKLDISSDWVIMHRLAILSCVEPEWYDCCINTCLAYAGPYSNLTSCPTCKEPRFTPKNKPRRLFCYIPIIPRLQGYFLNPKMSERLLYRHNYKHIDETIADVFDSIHYRTLCKQYVEVDGEELDHKYFCGKFDLALGVCLDSFLLFKRNRKGPSATPILIQNYSLPPEIRTHLLFLICAGCIPGTPKNVYSFLIPYDNELARLAVGVQTFDAAARAAFLLRAYNILKMGDIIAIEKALNITGHNGFSPCRSCEMKGARNVKGKGTNYYSPLTQPWVVGMPKRSWNPRNLPLRSHESFAKVAKKIDACDTKTYKKKIAKHYGIKGSSVRIPFHAFHAHYTRSNHPVGLPALRRVKSMHYGRSAPWDGMHLIENNAPNLYKLWSGNYKKLDVGLEDYQISDDMWDEIWQETADAVQHLPADFVRVLGNGPTYFTAEAWCFWIVYIAPVLLQGRFPDPKYHRHLCQYSEIIKRCLGFQITYDKIDELEDLIIDWVQKYEEYVPVSHLPIPLPHKAQRRYYYQYEEDRLSACPLTIHGLLHVPDDIRFCGPFWTTWTFWVERYCGFLQGGLKSKRFPFANLNNRILHHAYLEQLGARFDLEDELSNAAHLKGEISRFEHVYQDCEYFCSLHGTLIM